MGHKEKSGRNMRESRSERENEREERQAAREDEEYLITPCVFAVRELNLLVEEDRAV